MPARSSILHPPTQPAATPTDPDGSTLWLRHEPFPWPFAALWFSLSVPAMVVGLGLVVFGHESDNLFGGIIAFLVGAALTIIGGMITRSITLGVDDTAKVLRIHCGPSGIGLPPTDRAVPYSTIASLEARVRDRHAGHHLRAPAV